MRSSHRGPSCVQSEDSLDHHVHGGLHDTAPETWWWVPAKPNWTSQLSLQGSAGAPDITFVPVVLACGTEPAEMLRRCVTTESCLSFVLCKSVCLVHVGDCVGYRFDRREFGYSSIQGLDTFSIFFSQFAAARELFTFLCAAVTCLRAGQAPSLSIFWSVSLR